MASKRGVRRKRCDGKRKFPDDGAAWCFLRQRKFISLAGMRAYPCPFCRQWHVGHTKVSRLLEMTGLKREVA